MVTGLGLAVEPQHAGLVFWVILFVGLSTFLNLRGIKWTAHANHVLTAVMFLVIGIFVVDAVSYLGDEPGLGRVGFRRRRFTIRARSISRAVGTATSLAALTYIGFDGISTLAEEVREPKRTVPLAIVLVCLIIGLCAS